LDLCLGRAEANLVRGTFLRITDMRFRPANIRVAASRTTVRRRIVEHSEPDHHPPSSIRRHSKGAHKKAWRPSSSSVLAATDRALKASPSGGLRPALTALVCFNAPWNPAEEGPVDHLTSRSTSDP